MTALSANVDINRKEGDLIASPCAVDIIYSGALVKHNAAGYLEACSAEAGASFAGVAYEKVDNSAGSAGDVNARFFATGLHLLNGASFAQTDVGQLVFATDDGTITKTNAANLQVVGKIAYYVSATQVWVQLQGGSLPAATVAAIGTTSDLTALAPTATALTDLSTTDTYTDAAVNAIFAEVETAADLKADNTDVETLRTEVESRMDVIEAKVDEVIAALKASGIMLD